MNATKAARAAIHERVRDEIREASIALVSVSSETALDNWEYFFTQCRFQQAKLWWSVYERLRGK